MSKFWELVERSVVIQGVVTLGTLGVACYLWATVGVLPDGLQNILLVIVAFWMGSKSQQEAIRRQ